MKSENTTKKTFGFICLALYLVVAFFIFYTSFENGYNSNATSGKLTAFLINNFKFIENFANNYENFGGLVRKFVGHLGLFAVAGLFCSLAFTLLFNRRFLAVALTILNAVIVSLSSEITQAFSFNRVCSFTDVLIDLFGFILSLSLICSIAIIINFKTHNLHDEFKGFILLYLVSFLVTVALYLIFANKTLETQICAIFSIVFITLFLLLSFLILFSKLKKLKKE